MNGGGGGGGGGGAAHSRKNGIITLVRKALAPQNLVTFLKI